MIRSPVLLTNMQHKRIIISTSYHLRFAFRLLNPESIFSKVYLQSNKITSVDQICESALKGSNLEFFGCDAILCSPGTYNSLGRSRSYDNPCDQCNINGGAPFFGSTSCEAPKELTPKDAIELIYSSCGGQNWISNTNWMSDSVPVCQWEGIQCSGDGSIVEISLRSVSSSTRCFCRLHTFFFC